MRSARGHGGLAERRVEGRRRPSGLRRLSVCWLSGVRRRLVQSDDGLRRQCRDRRRGGCGRRRVTAQWLARERGRSTGSGRLGSLCRGLILAVSVSVGPRLDQRCRRWTDMAARAMRSSALVAPAHRPVRGRAPRCVGAAPGRRVKVEVIVIRCQMGWAGRAHRARMILQQAPAKPRGRRAIRRLSVQPSTTYSSRADSFSVSGPSGPQTTMSSIRAP